MAHKGKKQLIYVIVAPPDQVEEGDVFFEATGLGPSSIAVARRSRQYTTGPFQTFLDILIDFY